MTASAGVNHGRADARRGDWPIPLVVFGSYFLLKPFYFFPSGTPQLADFGVLALIGALLVAGTDHPRPRSVRVIFFAGLFVLYTVLLNAVWAALTGDPTLFKIPTFHMFNFGLLFLCLLLADRYGDRFFQYTLVAVAASLFLQVIFSLGAQGSARRQVIFFNNPNQLGYWGLLSASIFFVCSLRIRVPGAVKLAVCCASFYLVTLSLSKAAILSALGLFALAFATRPQQLFVAIPLGALALIALGGSSLYENLLWRFGDFATATGGDIAQRGYVLIGRFPQYLLFGAGDGDFDIRFGRHEIHSTLGTVFFNYGIVGLSLFAIFMYRVYREAGLYRFSFIAPAFVYGFTHQGLRFSVFWALVAITASVREVKETRLRGP